MLLGVTLALVWRVVFVRPPLRLTMPRHDLASVHRLPLRWTALALLKRIKRIRNFWLLNGFGFVRPSVPSRLSNNHFLGLVSKEVYYIL